MPSRFEGADGHGLSSQPARDRDHRGSLLEDREQVTTIIESLKNLGISISLDDFGTGYASLARLDSLPIDRIKIDKTFVNNIVKSKQTAAIVNTIASLGHTLHVPITAEGVESEHIRCELKKLGCSEAQGWLFGRAVSAETVHSYLKMAGQDEPASTPGHADDTRPVGASDQARGPIGDAATRGGFRLRKNRPR